MTDNIIFEALETFLPLATQKAPEPVVETDDSPEMEVVKDKIYMSLMYIGRVNHIKTKIKKGVRFWANRYVGAWKIGWDSEKNEISIIVVKPQNLIFDTDYGIDDGEYMGEYLGEKMEGIASDLITRFPDKKDDITKLCGEKLGSLMGYTQWWTKEALFYTMAGVVLGKYKNPNWNYDETKTITDADGNVSEKLVAGQNHFPHPQIPYAFLTVFDLGDEPCDKTSLIEQGLVTQDNINKRLKQIDRNADNINGGIVVSGQYFSKEAAAQVAQARREGSNFSMTAGVATFGSVQTSRACKPPPSADCKTFAASCGSTQRRCPVRGFKPNPGILTPDSIILTAVFLQAVKKPSANSPRSRINAICSGVSVRGSGNTGACGGTTIMSCAVKGGAFSNAIVASDNASRAISGQIAPRAAGHQKHHGPLVSCCAGSSAARNRG